MRRRIASTSAPSSTISRGPVGPHVAVHARRTTTSRTCAASSGHRLQHGPAQPDPGGHHERDQHRGDDHRDRDQEARPRRPRRPPPPGAARPASVEQRRGRRAHLVEPDLAQVRRRRDGRAGRAPAARSRPARPLPPPPPRPGPGRSRAGRAGPARAARPSPPARPASPVRYGSRNSGRPVAANPRTPLSSLTSATDSRCPVMQPRGAHLRGHRAHLHQPPQGVAAGGRARPARSPRPPRRRPRTPATAASAARCSRGSLAARLGPAASSRVDAGHDGWSGSTGGRRGGIGRGRVGGAASMDSSRMATSSSSGPPFSACARSTSRAGSRSRAVSRSSPSSSSSPSSHSRWPGSRHPALDQPVGVEQQRPAGLQRDPHRLPGGVGRDAQRQPDRRGDRPRRRAAAGSAAGARPAAPAPRRRRSGTDRHRADGGEQRRARAAR